MLAGVGYDADLSTAEEVMLDAVTETDGVDSEPAPQALLTELGDSAIVFDVRYWTSPKQAEVRQVQHDVIRNLKSSLDAAGIEIPFPIRTLEAGETLAHALRRAGGGGSDAHSDGPATSWDERRE